MVYGAGNQGTYGAFTISQAAAPLPVYVPSVTRFLSLDSVPRFQIRLRGKMVLQIAADLSRIIPLSLLICCLKLCRVLCRSDVPEYFLALVLLIGYCVYSLQVRCY